MSNHVHPVPFFHFLLFRSLAPLGILLPCGSVQKLSARLSLGQHYRPSPSKDEGALTTSCSHEGVPLTGNDFFAPPPLPPVLIAILACVAVQQMRYDLTMLR